MTELRKFQLRTLKILIEVDEFLKTNKLQYFLLYGTTLGAVRHKGFIPWDDDIDIGLYRKDFEKMEEIIVGKLPKKLLYCRIGENKFPDASGNLFSPILQYNSFLGNLPTIISSIFSKSFLYKPISISSSHGINPLCLTAPKVVPYNKKYCNLFVFKNSSTSIKIFNVLN